MRMGMTLALGFLIDALISPVTHLFWTGFVHDPIVRQLTDSGRSDTLALLLLDALGAALIMGGTGVVLAAMSVNYVLERR